MQLKLFEEEKKPGIHIDKPIRLIELFGGYGSQSMAMRNIGADFVPWKLVEFDRFAVASYNAVHGTHFETTDIRGVHGNDLEITGKDKYCYFMFYSFPCTDLSVAGKMAGMSKGSGTYFNRKLEFDNYRKSFVQKCVKRMHPAEKPVEFLERFIRVSCPENGVVLDPFMGSGSTGVAAKSLERNFVGIEKSPEYFEISKKRIEEVCNPSQMCFDFQ